MAARDIGVPARGAGIAMADRNEPVADGMAAARVTPLAGPAPELFRRAPQPAQNAPDQHRGDDGDAERQRKYRQRRLNAPAAPRQRDVAGLIGNPRRAYC